MSGLEDKVEELNHSLKSQCAEVVEDENMSDQVGGGTRERVLRGLLRGTFWSQMEAWQREIS